jgi:hypothetical protein
LGSRQSSGTGTGITDGAAKTGTWRRGTEDSKELRREPPVEDGNLDMIVGGIALIGDNINK